VTESLRPIIFFVSWAENQTLNEKEKKQEKFTFAL
jgi:hypothetical protein